MCSLQFFLMLSAWLGHRQGQAADVAPPWLVAAAYLPRQRATLTFICSRCLAPRGSVKSRVALTA